ncbi:hypothetical protein CHUAL_012982 [Chamberlinius hualienensis]
MTHQEKKLQFAAVFFISNFIFVRVVGQPLINKQEEKTTTPKPTTASSNSTEDILVGYIYSGAQLETPHVAVEAENMTAKHCTDLCGLYFMTNYSVVTRDDCKCVKYFNISQMLDQKKCQQYINCTKSKSEICGCSYDNNTYSAIYKIEYYNYQVSLINVRANDSFTVYLTVIGINNRETGERSCQIQKTSTDVQRCSFSARKLNNAQKLRIGTQNNLSNDKLQVDAVNITFSDLSFLINTNFSLSKSQVKEIILAENISSSDNLLQQPRSTSNKVSSNVYSSHKESGESANKEFDESNYDAENLLNLAYCLNNSIGFKWKDDCPDNVDGMIIFGVQYRYTIPFEHLEKISVVDECDDHLNMLPANVSRVRKEESTIHLECDWGYFYDFYPISRTTVQCQNDGIATLSNIPPFKNAYLKEPLVLPGSVDHYYDRWIYLAGADVPYCCRTGKIGQSSNLLAITCSPIEDRLILPDCQNYGAQSQEPTMYYYYCIGIGE